MVLVIVRLPETHPHASRKRISISHIAMQLILDKKVLGFGLIVGGCNGILFSYFAEGAFYLIEILGLSASHYGLSFIAIGSGAMLGGIVSRRLQNKLSSKEIMNYGLLIITYTTTIYSCITMINHYLFSLPSYTMIAVTIISQMICIFGTCVVTVNALALALVNYRHAIGTASSLFGFFYYCLISLFTFFMGFLHNGTLLPMPLYFCSLSYLMIAVNHMCLKS
ncbi:MFS transporter C-terminal domain protein [Rickettsiales endosymbiont of Paramecium tredecaurelia]|nr:MFS transporter C-terminal domain protein [Candidatus Sarmatiella mevalonica]